MGDMKKLKDTQAEKLAAKKEELWPSKLYRRRMSVEEEKEMEILKQSRIRLLEKSLGHSLSDDLKNVVVGLPKILKSYEDETRMCHYLGIGCTQEPTSMSLRNSTNVPSSDPALAPGSDDNSYSYGGGGNDAEDEDSESGEKLSEDEKKKVILDAYKDELKQADKVMVLSQKQEEKEHRQASKAGWFQQRSEYEEAEFKKQQEDEAELWAMVDKKHAEEQALHDANNQALMQKRDELMAEHEHLKQSNSNELYSARVENQGKLNDKRAELYTSYEKPNGPVEVEDSIIYAPADDDDGDDDDAEGDDEVNLEDENTDPHLPEYESTPDEPSTDQPHTSDAQQEQSDGEDDEDGEDDMKEGQLSLGKQSAHNAVKFAKLSTHLSKSKLVTDSVKL